MIFAAKPLAVVVGYMVTWFGWVDNLLFLSKLEKVTDITQLKPGDKIISIGVTSEILEFLCIHPHNNNYSLFLNSDLDGTKKFYNDKLRNGNYYKYSDKWEVLAMKETINWYKEQVNFMEKLLHKREEKCAHDKPGK